MRWSKAVLAGVAGIGTTAAAIRWVAARVEPPETRGPARVTIAEDPPPNVTLPPALAALACPPGGTACANESADLVASMAGWVETPKVDNGKMLADCAKSARIAKELGSGVGMDAFERCVRDRRQRTLWLPAPAFRLPKVGWFAFAWRDDSFCDLQEGGCRVVGVVDLATGAAAAVKLRAPQDGAAVAPRPKVLLGTVPIKTARETALAALIAPHVAGLGVAITADVPPDLPPPPRATDDQKRRPDRFVTMRPLFGRQSDRWAWLSPTDETWATGSTQLGAVSGAILGRIRDLSQKLRGRCPPHQPRPDLQKVYAALGDEADPATLSAMRAAIERCASGG